MCEEMHQSGNHAQMLNYGSCNKNTMTVVFFYCKDFFLLPMHSSYADIKCQESCVTSFLSKALAGREVTACW